MLFNRKFTAVLSALAVMSAFCAAPCGNIITNAEETTAVEAELTADYTYVISGGEATIISVNKELTEFEIPTEIEGCPVTALDGHAFQNGKITSLTVPDGITQIGEKCFFNCAELREISLPDTLETIGSGAFMNCTALKSLDMPDSVTDGGKAAFYGCTSLETVKLSANITELAPLVKKSYDYDGIIEEDYGYMTGCTSLKEIVIPDSVETIGYRSFADCTSLVFMVK